MATSVKLPSRRYASAESYSSSTPSSSSSSSSLSSSSDCKKNNRNVSALQRFIPDAVRGAASDNSSRALAKTRSAGGGGGLAPTGHNLSTMMKKFMEKRSHPKPSPPDRPAALIVPPDLIAADLKRGAATAAAKGSNLSALSRKLFQKGGAAANRTSGKAALTDVKTNTRTLAMVLRSERELLAQNKEYEGRVSELLLLLEGKDREIDKLKDLCLKQREEIKALKDAILFPDVMNSQLQNLLEEQGSELKQAKHVIPTLQNQVTSLTRQLKCLEENLAEVKADKYAVNQCFDGHISSPVTPMIQEAANPLVYSSGGPMTLEYGSPDEMFLKDLNPCLTPCFSKTKSQEYHEIGGGNLSKSLKVDKSNAISSTDYFQF